MLDTFFWINFKIEFYLIYLIWYSAIFFPLKILRMRFVYNLLIGVCYGLN